MPPPHVCTAFLRPPLGPCLALRQGETWIGRGSFEASQRGQLLCSRRQAVIQNNGETGLRLECHGCNPLYFVVCQSANFFATQTTPVAELYQLKKGEAVELINGDQFYFIATECLLTVFIKQHDAALCQELSSQVVSPQIPPPTIEQLRQCSALDTTSVSGFQPEDVQIQATTNPDIENGKSVPPDLCPGDRKTLSSSHAVCLGQGQMMQMAVDRCVVETMRINDRSIESTLSKDVATTSVYGVQPEDAQIQAATNPDIENGKSLLPDLCPGERETLSSSHVACLGQGQMMQMAVDRHVEESMRMDDRSVESTLLEDVAPHSWPAGPVEGMEDVIASISGYSGHDRSNLIKLIYKTGGAYTGGVSAANTHLVCWNFSGKKFEIAKQQRKLLINHRWFEDCLLLGRRLPEEKYTFRSGEELGPLRWRESPVNMGIETVEYSGKKMKESVNKEAAVGKGEFNEQIQDTNSELLGLLHLHQDTNDGANSSQYRQSLYSAVHNLPDHVSPPSGQAELTPAVVAPNRSRTSLKMVKDADLDQRINGPLASVLEGPPRREPLASGSSSKRAKIVQRGAKVSVGVLEHQHASSVPGRPEFVAHSRRRKLRRLAKGIESYCIEQSPTTAGAEIPVRMESTSTGTCLDRARISSSRQEKFNGGLEVINLGDDDDGEDAGLVDHYPAKPGTQIIECDKMKDRSFNAEVSCAICLTDAKSCSEGLLGCGHRFCFLCIFKWADEASKGPTCPLCKASFDIITMQENTSPSNSPGRSAASLLKEKVVLVGDKMSLPAFGRSRPIVVESVCIVCGSSDTAEMLVQCSGCGDRACHTFCLDPPAPPPWFCSRCTQGRRRLSMRDAWGQVLPTASTGVSPPRTYGRSTSHGRRWSRFQQPYASAQLAHQESTLYRSSNRDMIHTRPSSRRVTGQHSLHSWLQPGS